RNERPSKIFKNRRTTMKANMNSSNKNFSQWERARLRHFLAAGSVLVMIAALMSTPLLNIIRSVAAMGVSNSVIIQLKDDPAAVWKAKLQKAGQSVSAA